MKRRYLNLPPPLRRQVLMHLAYFATATLTAVSMLILGMEFFVAASLFIIAGFFLFRAFNMMLSKYVVIRGKCVSVCKNVLHARAKWIILEIDKKRVRIHTSSKLKTLFSIDDLIAVYVSDKARVYESEGGYSIYEYWAIEREGV